MTLNDKTVFLIVSSLKRSYLKTKYNDLQVLSLGYTMCRGNKLFFGMRRNCLI